MFKKAVTFISWSGGGIPFRFEVKFKLTSPPKWNIPSVSLPVIVVALELFHYEKRKQVAFTYVYIMHRRPEGPT